MPAGRNCSARYCPEIVTGGKAGYCDAHKKTTSQRGYGYAHQRRRNQIRRDIERDKTIVCVTCNVTLDHGFHLGHTDDRTGYLGPQCAPCNLAAAGRKSANNRYT